MSGPRSSAPLRAARAPAARRRAGDGDGAPEERGRPPAPAAPVPDAVRYGALATPRPVRVDVAADGAPLAVDIDGRRRVVEAVRDDWLVQDLWWTERPVERHYHELVVHPGRVTVLYRDLLTDRWHRH